MAVVSIAVPSRRHAAGRVWGAAACAILDLPVALLAAVPLAILFSASVGLLPVFLLGLVVFAVGVVWWVRGFSELERARGAALLDVDVPQPPWPRWQSAPRWVWAYLSSASFWRTVAYVALLVPAAVLGWVVSGIWLGAGLALLALPAYVAAVPSEGLLAPGSAWATAGWTALGLGLVVAWPFVLCGYAALRAAMMRLLLGPSKQEALAARVEAMRETRDAAVDAAEIERRRIERDLHDGAQPRLIAVAMDLGMAQSKIESDPDQARELVARAHREAKEAITDLRNLARGIHPSILVDRGLDAALSALAARCPVPVNLEVDAGARCPSHIEAVAYFVVAEALTNVAKHAQASRVEVRVLHHRERLTITVFDDGRGGATATPGSGLEGLTNRVRAVEGTFDLTSPPGGPTTLHVDLPCAS